MIVTGILRMAPRAITSLLSFATILSSSTADAGPPFLTDDPEPTDAGHWEIYAPLGETFGKGSEFEGTMGAELNYGAIPDLQLTLGLPGSYAHDASGWRFGRGDLEVSAKYRFYHSEASGISVAAFPGLTLPTARHDLGGGKVTALLPIWAQKDIGPWAVFGGGGYAINPGAGNHDYWTGGIALTRQFAKRLLVGVEAYRQGADTVGGSASTSLGVGAIWNLKSPFRLLASGGPTFNDKEGQPGFHGFIALGFTF